MSGDTVWIGVNAEVKGFMGTVGKAATEATNQGKKTLEEGFREGGENAGKAAAEGLQNQAKAIEAVSTKLGTARKAEASAAADVHTEETKLENLRQSGNATASQLAQAEQRVETAKRKMSDAASRAARHQDDLNAVSEGGTATSTALGNATDRLATAQTKAATESAKLHTAELKTSEAKEKAEAASERVASAEMNLIDVRDRYGAGTKEATAAQKELDAAKKALETASNQVATAEGNELKGKAELANANDQVAAKAAQLSAVQEELAAASSDAGDEAEEAGNQIRDMGSDMDSADAPAQGLMSSLGGLAGQAALTAGAFIGIRGIGDMISSGFDKVTSIEDTTASLSILMGSAEEATATMDLLTESNMKTPYSFDSWSEAGKNLIAFGFDAETANESMIALGEAAAASGKGEQALGSMADAFGKAAASGRISMDLVNSLAQGGVDALGILGNEFGVSTEEMQKMISNGTLPVEEAFDALTTGIMEGTDGINGETLAMSGVMEEMSETTSGRLGLLKMSFVNLAGDLVQLVMPAIKGVADVGIEVIAFIRDLIKGITDGEGPLGAFKDVFEFLSPILKPLAAIIGGIAAAIVVKTAAIKAYNIVTGIAAKVTTAFKTALDLLAKNKVIVIIGLVVGALVWFFTQTEIGQRIWSGFVDFLGKAWENIVGFFQAAWDKIAPVFEWIGDAWSNLVDFFSGGDLRQSIMDALGLDEDSPLVRFADMISDAFDTVKDVIGDAVEWISEKWGEFTSLFSGDGEGGGFLDSFSEKWEMFTTGLGQFYETWIKPLFDGFLGYLETLGEIATLVFEYVIKPAWEGLKAAFQLAWEAVIKPVFNAFQNAGQILGAFLKMVFETIIVPAFRFIGDQISNVWNNLIKPVWDFIADAAGLLADLLTGNFDNIGNRFGEMGESIGGIVDGVITFAMETFENLVNLLGDTWEGFRNTVGDVVSAVAGFITDMVDDIGEIPGKVKDFFLDAGSWLLDAGRNIINGLWEGMKEKWGDVTGWLSRNLSFSAIGSWIGFSSGGVVHSYADGAITNYAAGGIDRLESYANGGARRENHTAQIAPAGAWRVWAEPETGGESYIPHAQSKRSRSTAILAKTADLFGMSIVDKRTGDPVNSTYRGGLGPVSGAVQTFADGGIRTTSQIRDFVEGKQVDGHGMERSLDGAPYTQQPGPAAWGDCSSTQGRIFDFIIGKNPVGPRAFWTGSQESYLRSNGATIGRGPAGTFRMGWNNRGAAAHTSGTLPDDTNVEMGGGNGGGAIGGGAVPWDHPQFDHWAWIRPAEGDGSPSAGSDIGDMAGPGGATAAAIGSSGAPGSDSDAGAAPGAVAESAPTTWSEVAGESAKLIVSGQVADALGVFGVPDEIPPMLQALRDVGVEVNETDSAESQEIVGSEATDATPSAGAEAAEIAGVDTGVDESELPDWGEPFFVREITRAAKDMGLSREAAVIGTGTAIVEAGRPIKMWANNAVPESLEHRHDAVGSDYDSVGIMQQRNNGAWGTVAQRMDAYESAKMFFAELQKLDWENMGRGEAAQSVQRSAHPGRYEPVMADAEALVDEHGVIFADATSTPQALASGGPVRGPGGPTDDLVAAWLSNGEYVVNAAGASGNEPLLEAINSGADVASMLASAGIDVGREVGHAGLSAAATLGRSGLTSIAAALGPAGVPLAAAGSAGIGLAETFGGFAVDQLADAADRMADAGISTLADGAASYAGSDDVYTSPTVAPGASTPTPEPDSSGSESTTVSTSDSGEASPQVVYNFVHRDEEAAWRRFRESQAREAAGFGVLRH